MEQKRINESPSVGDLILLELTTAGADGVPAQPDSVDRIAVYFVERTFGDTNQIPYEHVLHEPVQIKKDVQEARKLQLSKPDDQQEKARLMQMQRRANKTVIAHTSYYKEAHPVWTVGREGEPAWTGERPSRVKAVPDQPGHFHVTWDTHGQREGNYFVQWTWTPAKGHQPITAHQSFLLEADRTPKTTQRVRYTPTDKYEILLQRYMPNMVKLKVANVDATPFVVGNLNKSVAQGFTFLEDMANQIIDTLDANLAPTSLLGLLGNHFNLQLKSNDPMLWRRQIKNAVPLFKQKGTREGLRVALDQAGIKLQKLTLLWQVISPYTWVDGFHVGEQYDIEFAGSGDNLHSFELSKVPLPVNPDHFELALRPDGEDKYITLPPEYVKFVPPLEPTGKTLMVWQGGEAERPINLVPGDYLRVTYQHKEIPPEQEAVEKYVRSLPLADLRDEVKQVYPLKNWNVKVIEEDNPMFNVLIPERHPFHPPVVFGRVRTVFLFSENVYNMDTYNGSLRDSTRPCDIDRDFVDACSGGQSSLFNVDLEFEELSNDRILEAQDIIQEYAPFHAVLHSINICGLVNQFILPPQQTIEPEITPTDGLTLQVRQENTIGYIIEWSDGTLEKGLVN